MVKHWSNMRLADPTAVEIKTNQLHETRGTSELSDLKPEVGKVGPGLDEEREGEDRRVVGAAAPGSTSRRFTPISPRCSRPSRAGCRSGVGLHREARILEDETITDTASDLGMSAGALHGWVRQDRIDRGELPGSTTTENIELTRARKRIRELETEIEILRRATELLGEANPNPKGSTR